MGFFNKKEDDLENKHHEREVFYRDQFKKILNRYSNSSESKQKLIGVYPIAENFYNQQNNIIGKINIGRLGSRYYGIVKLNGGCREFDYIVLLLTDKGEFMRIRYTKKHIDIINPISQETDTDEGINQDLYGFYYSKIKPNGSFFEHASFEETAEIQNLINTIMQDVVDINKQYNIFYS